MSISYVAGVCTFSDGLDMFLEPIRVGKIEKKNILVSVLDCTQLPYADKLLCTSLF